GAVEEGDLRILLELGQELAQVLPGGVVQVQEVARHVWLPDSRSRYRGRGPAVPTPPRCGCGAYPSVGRGRVPTHSAEHAFTSSGSTSVATRSEIHTRCSRRSSNGRAQTLHARTAGGAWYFSGSRSGSTRPPAYRARGSSRGNGGQFLKLP